MRTFNDLINNNHTPTTYDYFKPQTVDDLRNPDPIVRCYNEHFSNLTETIMVKELDKYYITGPLTASHMDWEVFASSHNWRNVPYERSFNEWCEQYNLRWVFRFKNGHGCVEVENIKPDLGRMAAGDVATISVTPGTLHNIANEI